MFVIMRLCVQRPSFHLLRGVFSSIISTDQLYCNQQQFIHVQRSQFKMFNKPSNPQAQIHCESTTQRYKLNKTVGKLYRKWNDENLDLRINLTFITKSLTQVNLTKQQQCGLYINVIESQSSLVEATIYDFSGLDKSESPTSRTSDFLGRTSDQ